MTDTTNTTITIGAELTDAELRFVQNNANYLNAEEFIPVHIASPVPYTKWDLDMLTSLIASKRRGLIRVTHECKPSVTVLLSVDDSPNSDAFNYRVVLFFIADAA